MTVSNSSNSNDFSTLWCVDIAVVSPSVQNPIVPDVTVHGAMIHIDRPWDYNIAENHIVARYVEHLKFLGKQDQDGCWRYFYGESGGKIEIVVQLHPWASYVKQKPVNGIVSETIVARDKDSFLTVNRWSLDERFCKFELINGARPNDVYDDRSVMVLSNAEIRHLVQVLQNVLSAKEFYYFDDPLWRGKLTAAAERNVGQTYEEWSLTNR